MKTLYLECTMGGAGDMLMAALYELLDEQQKLQFLQTMNSLGLPGVTVAAEAAQSCGVAGTHMRVTVDGLEEDDHHSHEHTHHHDHEHHHDHDHDHDHEHEHTHSHHHTSAAEISAILAKLPLPEKVRAQAEGVYRRIAQAESEAHGTSVELVHFHEVGALDAVADVAGTCLAIHLLAPERVVVSPIHVGSGQVRCAHGIVPVPAPATANLLRGVPSYGGTIQGELCTPTGAALLVHLADKFGPMPLMAVERIGIGLGGRQFPAANCLRAFWGESGGQGLGEICQLTCNLDDMTPEALSFACQRLLELGALDVYTLPGQMKKGRPGWQLTLLCDPEREAEFAAHLLRQTTTNGLRAARCRKYYLPPQVETVETSLGPVRIKTASNGGVTHRKAEFDDVAALAQKNGLSFQAAAHIIERETGAQQ